MLSFRASPKPCPAGPRAKGESGAGRRRGVRKDSEGFIGGEVGLGCFLVGVWGLLSVDPGAEDLSHVPCPGTKPASLRLCLPRSTTCTAGGSESSTTRSGSSRRITWWLPMTWRSDEDRGTPGERWHPGVHLLGMGCWRWVLGEAALFLGCPSISGVPSLEDCLWLHLLVSILHGSRQDREPQLQFRDDARPARCPWISSPSSSVGETW